MKRKQRSHPPAKVVRELEIIRELRAVLAEKLISPEAAAPFIGVSSREVRRWADGVSVPTIKSRGLIIQGIKKIKKVL